MAWNRPCNESAVSDAKAGSMSTQSVGRLTLSQWLVIIIGLGALLVPFIILAQAGESSVTDWRLGYWLLFLGVLAALFVTFGYGITGRFGGLLIDQRNRMSLSRLQISIWTVLVLSTIMAAGASNLAIDGWEGAFDSLNIPTELWALMGISTGALAGASLIKGDQMSRPQPDENPTSSGPGLPVPDPGVSGARPPTAVVQRLADSRDIRDARQIRMAGLLLTLPSPKAASFSDLFQGEQGGNAVYLDLGKVQMFFFTLVLALAYAVAVGKMLAGETSPLALPGLDESFVALLGISQGGYLVTKAAPHPDRSNE